MSAPAILDTPWIFLFPFIWIIGWVGVSVIYRLRVGKPLFPRIPGDAIVSQRLASGRNRRNWLIGLGRARNCLNVAVTRNELLVSPMFPFNLMFLPEIYGLEVRLPLSSITSVERTASLWGEMLTVHFGDKGPLDLRLRDPDSFERALTRR